MQSKGQTSKEYFTLLTIIHAALLSVQLILAMAFYYINATSTTGNDAAELDSVFQIVVPAFMIASYVGSTILLKTQLKSLRAKAELKEKLSGYRGTVLIKFAMLEIPTIFSLVCYQLTSNYLYLGIAGLLMIAFVLNRPTQYNAANDLELNPSERAILENPEAIVAEVKQRDL